VAPAAAPEPPPPPSPEPQPEPIAALAPQAAAVDPAGPDLRKMLADLKLPPMPDADALLGAHRKNLEALAAAHKAALEGAQEMAKRQSEIWQQTAKELGETLRAFSAAKTPQDKAAKQAEILRSAYERAVSNTKELSELIQRTNSRALGLLNERFTEALQEAKSAFSISPRGPDRPV
jgi:phasin family protein